MTYFCLLLGIVSYHRFFLFLVETFVGVIASSEWVVRDSVFVKLRSTFIRALTVCCLAPYSSVKPVLICFMNLMLASRRVKNLIWVM